MLLLKLFPQQFYREVEVSEEDLQTYLNEGYYPIVLESLSVVGEMDIYDLNPTYSFNETEKVWIKKIKFEVSHKKIIKKISNMKQQLADTDYKVVKNMESQMAMEELPYEPIELHNERQVLRDKINELETLLKGE
jgi:hypothetical protein